MPTPKKVSIKALLQKVLKSDNTIEVVLPENYFEQSVSVAPTGEPWQAFNDKARDGIIAILNQDVEKNARITKASLKDALQVKAQAEKIANYLFDNLNKLDKEALGDILASEAYGMVRDAYFKRIQQDLDLGSPDSVDNDAQQAKMLVKSLKECVEGKYFILPGEAQKIDRLIQASASTFNVDNIDQDQSYVLGFAITMLNTNLHNPQVPEKMTKQQFKQQLKDGFDVDQLPFSDDFVFALYDEIQLNPMIVKAGVQAKQLTPQEQLLDNIQQIMQQGKKPVFDKAVYDQLIVLDQQNLLHPQIKIDLFIPVRDMYQQIQSMSKKEALTEQEQKQLKNYKKDAMPFVRDFAKKVWEAKVAGNPKLNDSVLIRGQSFVDAALLMIEHSNISDAEKNASQLLVASLNQTWREKDGSFLQKDLAELENALITFVNRTLYSPVKDFKKVKDELDNAENHVNWRKRDEIHKTMDDLKEFTTHRHETPVATFTKAQESEWLAILPGKSKAMLGEPEWFKQISSDWEKNYLIGKVQNWVAQRDNPDGVKNLGEYLGSVPTTIRRYPGAPNAYKTQITVAHGDKTYTFNKIRSGVLAPTKTKVRSWKTKQRKAKQQDKVRVTTQNLEQLVIQAIQDKIEQFKDMPDLDKGHINFPILLQTLYSPPFQPPGQYNNESLMKAFDNVKNDLKDPNAFIEKHGIDAKGCHFDSMNLHYTSRPVNAARQLSSVLTSGSKQGIETIKTMRAIKEYVPNQPDTPDEKMARAAFNAIENIGLAKNSMAELLTQNTNALAEVAALEQIVMDKVGGIRIGSCVSGKDREEMITEMCIAMVEFYARHDRFPPPPNPSNKQDQALREEFNLLVARQFLSGVGQKLAEENAKGCEGLKNIADVYRKDICKKIRDLAPSYGINPEVFDPVKDTQRLAGLNKLSVKKLKVDASALLTKAFSNLKRMFTKKEPKQEQEQPQPKISRRHSWTPGLKHDQNGKPPLVRRASTTDLSSEKKDKPKPK